MTRIKEKVGFEIPRKVKICFQNDTRDLSDTKNEKYLRKFIK